MMVVGCQAMSSSASVSETTYFGTLLTQSANGSPDCGPAGGPSPPRPRRLGGARRQAPGPQRTRSYSPAGLSISVLGRLEVGRAGRVVPLPGGKASELLVRLAVEAGVAIRVDRLLDDLAHHTGAHLT